MCRILVPLKVHRSFHRSRRRRLRSRSVLRFEAHCQTMQAGKARCWDGTRAASFAQTATTEQDSDEAAKHVLRGRASD